MIEAHNELIITGERCDRDSQQYDHYWERYHRDTQQLISSRNVCNRDPQQLIATVERCDRDSQKLVILETLSWRHKTVDLYWNAVTETHNS